MQWGLIVGFVGTWIGGVLVPLMIWPHSPQGPLIGIFVALPICVSGGVLLGIIKWLRSLSLEINQ